MGEGGVPAAADVLGDRARSGVPIGPATTYRVGGDAALHVRAETVDDLHLAARAVGRSGVDVLVLGRGSNLLVADTGFDGLVVELGDAFGEVTIEATSVTAGGAALLPVVARQTSRAGLTGFEWAVGVPGSVGGAVRMNAGGHGSDMAATLQSIRVIDLATDEDEVVSASALELGYRRSSIRSSQVVVSAAIELRPGDPERSSDELSEIVGWRREHQPGGQNAGSVFTNPEGDSAGRLIEAAGAKGLRLGSAAVSDKHANFMQADAGGRAADVLALMRRVQDIVRESTGVELAVETRIVGFGPEEDQR